MLPLRDNTNLSRSGAGPHGKNPRAFKGAENVPSVSTVFVPALANPKGDLDDPSILVPSPPKPRTRRAGSPNSQDTNETSHDNSSYKKHSDDSKDLLECEESLGTRQRLNMAQEPMEPLPPDEASCIQETAMDDPSESEDLSQVFGTDTLNYLIAREQAYQPDAYCLEKLQPHITWVMRAILMDWMMEVCAEFKLKRETFHYALNYVDRYLSKTKNVAKTQLQLIGVSALYLASKMEEIYPPRVTDFAKATDDGYSAEEICDMEKTLARALRWELVPPTLSMWASWYMSQWDQYIQNSPYAVSHPLLRLVCDPLVVFKLPNEKAYARFRELTQLMDAMTLDVLTLQYHPRALVASTMYLLLAFHFGQATKEEMATAFYQSSHFITACHPFNDLFGNFLIQCFGFQLTELLPTIQYVATFMALPFSYQLPNRESSVEGHFEDFLAQQTYHPQQMDFIRGKMR